MDKYAITCSLSGNPDRAERWQRNTVVHKNLSSLHSFYLSRHSLSFICSRISTVDRALDCWAGSGWFDSDFGA